MGPPAATSGGHLELITTICILPLSGIRCSLLVRVRTALGRSGRNSQLANLYSEIADASDVDYILGMLERQPGFINAVKRLRLEKQALPVLKKRVMEAADGNRSLR